MRNYNIIFKFLILFTICKGYVLGFQPRNECSRHHLLSDGTLHVQEPNCQVTVEVEERSGCILLALCYYAIRAGHELRGKKDCVEISDDLGGRETLCDASHSIYTRSTNLHIKSGAFPPHCYVVCVRSEEDLKDARELEKKKIIGENCARSGANVGWNGFKGTFGDPNDPNTFRDLPKKVYEADEQGWKINSKDCTNDGKFYGWRLLNSRANEEGVGLLYDSYGTIAGIQVLLNQYEMLSKPHPFRYELSEILQNETIEGIPYFIQTYYFIEPYRICTGGRTDFELIECGTGDGLYLQNGNINDIITIPLTRNEAAEMEFTNLRCLRGMGYHNFYRLNESFTGSGCTEYKRPLFLLYNMDEELVGFGPLIPGTANSVRFEHPNTEGMEVITGPEYAAQCIRDQVNNGIGITTFHVYMVDDPYNEILCPGDVHY